MDFSGHGGHFLEGNHELKTPKMIFCNFFRYPVITLKVLLLQLFTEFSIPNDPAKGGVKCVFERKQCTKYSQISATTSFYTL